MDRWRVLDLALTEGERPVPNRVLDTGRRRSVWVHETLRKRRNHGEYQELHLDVGLASQKRSLTTVSSLVLLSC